MNEKTIALKAEVVSQIGTVMDNSQSFVVVEYRGLSVAKLTELRRSIAKQGGTLTVYKNGLVSRAAKERGYEMDDILVGPNAFVSCTQDPVSVPNLLVKFSKRAKQLVIKGGIVENKVLHAEEMVGQEMPVVIDNGFGGVILHEACVHSLEATSVARGLSVFSNMIGEKIASDVVTAIDDGTLKNSWGSLNVDDEGNPTQRNVLIENGILKSYLFDYRNQRRVNHPLTGSGRRESYKYSPTSRMNNTFIANGTSTFDEIIAATKYGLYAKSMGGGSVNPTTGEFNFAVTEGYIIRDGKICEPVRGATLIGSGKDTLLKIDMVANNLSYGQGMCGSASGSIPTDVGQPTIRVSSMTVGGRGSK